MGTGRHWCLPDPLLTSWMISNRSFAPQDSVFSVCLRSHTDWRLSWEWKLPLARLSTQCSSSEGAALPKSVQSHILQVLITSGGWKAPNAHTKLIGESGTLCDTLGVPLTGNGSNGLQSASFQRSSKPFGWKNAESSRSVGNLGCLCACSALGRLKQISTIRVHVSLPWEAACTPCPGAPRHPFSLSPSLRRGELSPLTQL